MLVESIMKTQSTPRSRTLPARRGGCTLIELLVACPPTCPTKLAERRRTDRAGGAIEAVPAGGPANVPEIDPGGFGAAVAFLSTSLALLERRRTRAT